VGYPLRAAGFDGEGMSISIDLHIYEADKLIEALKTWGAKDEVLLKRILEECGTFLGNSYVLLNNEYGGESPYYAVASLLDSAFEGKDSFDLFLFSEFRRKGISYVEDEEVAERLGFELRHE
jgi:hypothetical protein